ncbi:MAG: SH3 domain-containing protein [Nodosilinea sp. LVE1205-7]
MKLVNRIGIVPGRVGTILTILLLASVGCRPPADGGQASSATPTPTVVAAADRDHGSAPGYKVTSMNPPRSATLASENSQAQINLRSQPSLQAEVVGQGRLGDGIQLLSLAEAEGGYTWYYGRLERGQPTGWVRGDLVKVGGPMPTTAPGAAAGDPAQPCGPDRLEASFETPSFSIQICNAQGKFRYLSTDKTTQVGIVIQTVIHNQDTYIAIDGDRQYHINNQGLGVYQVNNGNYSQLAAEKVVKSQ